jgi:hypothetical protein
MAEQKVSSDAKGAFIAACVLSCLASIIDSGIVGWLIAPFAIGLFVFAASRAPLKSSLLVVMFLALTLENPSEMPAMGAWKSPLFTLGQLLLTQVKKTTGMDWQVFTGMDLVLVLLGAIAWSRRPRNPAVPTPKPLIRLAQLSLAGTAFVWIGGLLRGGLNNIALWQVNRVLYLPLFFLLFQSCFRGLQDYAALRKVVLWAALIRAALAVYVQWEVEVLIDPKTGVDMWLDYSTSHHDSMLFAWAAVILVAPLIHKNARQHLKNSLYLMPLLFAGMIANQRRMVWVQIILVFAILYFATPTNPVKKKVERAVKILIPFALLYVAAGWSNPKGIFAPVETIRSSVDSEYDTSTQWRDIENFNMLSTIRMTHFWGTGYGHGFIEFIPLPHVAYELERFVPHNSILGLWTYGGYLGYTSMTLLWVAGVYFAMRTYRLSTDADVKTAALACFGAIPIYYLQCYGDMGMGAFTGVFMMASTLALSGKLAVAVGAWPGARQSAPAAAEAPHVESVPPPAAQQART